MNKRFDEFNKNECIRNNIKITLLFFLILFTTIAIDIIMFKISQPHMQKLDNMFADLIAILMFIFFTLFILIIYNAVIFFRSKIYRDIYNNIKAFIGIVLCNLLVTAFLYITTKSILQWLYIGAVVLIDSAIFSVRYGRRKFNESKETERIDE